MNCTDPLRIVYLLGGWINLCQLRGYENGKAGMTSRSRVAISMLLAIFGGVACLYVFSPDQRRISTRGAHQ